MPIEEDRCECGDRYNKCPECGSDFVTPRDGRPMASPSDIIDYGHEDEDEPFKFTHICWECGWKESVVMAVIERVEY